MVKYQKEEGKDSEKETHLEKFGLRTFPTALIGVLLKQDHFKRGVQIPQIGLFAAGYLGLMINENTGIQKRKN